MFCRRLSHNITVFGIIPKMPRHFVQAFEISFILCVFIFCILIIDVVNDFFFFEVRIEPSDEDTKFADVWPIENIQVFMKEKMRRKTFENFDFLVDFINSKWQKITSEQCAKQQ